MIKTVNLRKAYRLGDEKVIALDCINLEIPKGQVCCILGTSGSGKSTLLNQLAGLEKPTKGEVYIKGKRISDMSEKSLAFFRQKNIGFVFQSYNLLPGLSAIDNVALPLAFRRWPRRVRMKSAKEMLARVGLGKRLNHTPAEMSGGQQQRVGIARAFVAKPDVVFADEPTGNLDTRTTREIMDLFMEFSRTYGITIVLVSHDNNLSLYADRIVTLVDGEIISDKINRSLYDVTADLKKILLPLVQSDDHKAVYDLMMKYSTDYTEGVCVQALEQAFATIQNPREFMTKLSEFAATDLEKIFFRKLGRETGAIPRETDSRRLTSSTVKITKRKGPGIFTLLFKKPPK